MKTVTLPAAVLFGTMIGLGLTGFLFTRKTNQLLDYAILMFISCIISILVCARSGCAFGVIVGMTMVVIGVLCLLAATVCVACAFLNKE